jgi:hypothetical protein
MSEGLVVPRVKVEGLAVVGDSSVEVAGGVIDRPHQVQGLRVLRVGAQFRFRPPEGTVEVASVGGLADPF